LGRRECGLKLKELGALADGMDSAAVSVSIRRFERRLVRNAKLRRIVHEIKSSIVDC
jgi:hypothetical protein